MRKLAWLLLVVAVVLPACHQGRISGVKGSGKREVQKRDVAQFTSISTEGAFEIHVTCQKQPSLEIEADDNIISLIDTEVSNNVLRLSNNKGYSTSEPVKIKISVPNLEGLSVSGAGSIDIKDMNNESFKIDSEGAPSITVSGTTKLINIDASGAGSIDTHKLRASRGVVESNGVSNVELDVKDQLDVKVSGPSTVFYRGDPKVNKTVNGPGTVQRKGNEGA